MKTNAEMDKFVIEILNALKEENRKIYMCYDSLAHCCTGIEFGEWDETFSEVLDFLFETDPRNLYKRFSNLSKANRKYVLIKVVSYFFKIELEKTERSGCAFVCSATSDESEYQKMAEVMLKENGFKRTQNKGILTYNKTLVWFWVKMNNARKK